MGILSDMGVCQMNRRFKMNAINFREIKPYKENYSLITRENSSEIKLYLSYAISKQIEHQVDMLLNDITTIIVQNLYGGNNEDE